ncbi:SDR family NAD(P)-dependent oxidoreductase [Dyadobacter tibetensis]|uniref:SDR family NAD(P)-dependent oxidoreductase n=1 Tax=Dyadobacter tibetensis TaxID=1211851 RepID=UPI0004728EF1|nr:SDR family NAD(P)-dependent oxidoreductase [Dyadobacter tibetensis]
MKSQIINDRYDPIAIIGMACRVPSAKNYNEFWKNLSDAKASITEVPADRWNWEEHSHSIQGGPNTLTKWGGFIEDISHFDASFFNISGKEAELMDPQQRIMLELAWHCMEDAAYRPSQLAGTDTAVFLGVFNHDYKELVERFGSIEAHHGTGTSAAIIPNRISYFYNLNGPSVPVDTACSSSAQAIHMAAQAIHLGDCSMALAGGVGLLLSPSRYTALAKAGMLSPTGTSKTFDDEANGFVRGEGAGLVLLKSLQQAEKDGDRIYGIIRGSAVNHCGKTYTITYPNPDSQAEVIKKALDRAAIQPQTIGYIEAHGTGTPKGDPIEFEGLLKAFDAYSNPPLASSAYCGLGSVKANIGHLEPAAAVAGLIKVLLAMKHQTLPKLVHFTQPNKKISLNGSPFYIVDHLKTWKRLKDQDGTEIPRRAGISSFGFGGTNAHLVIEEYVQPTREKSPDLPSYIICLSAKTWPSLHQRISDLLAYLKRPEEPINLLDLSYTLLMGRDHFNKRISLVVRNLNDLLKQLQSTLDELNQRQENRDSTKNHLMEDPLIGIETPEALVKNYLPIINKLSHLYSNGFNWDWDRIFEGIHPKKLGLPHYPFTPTSYWFSRVSEEEKQLVHPFIQKTKDDTGKIVLEGTPPLNPPYCSNLDSFITCSSDIPHGYLLEMVRESLLLESVRPGGPRISLTFDHFEYPNSLKDLPKSKPHTLRCISDVGVTDRMTVVDQVHGLPVFSCRAREDRKTKRARQNLDSVQILQAQAGYSHEQTYQLLEKAGFAYGPHYRSIQEISILNNQFIAGVQTLEAAYQGFKIYPDILETAFQLGMLWQHYKISTIQLNTRITYPTLKSITFFSAFKSKMWAIMAVQKNSSGVNNVLEIDLCNDSGLVCAHLILVIKNIADDHETLNSSSQADTLYLGSYWKTAPPVRHVYAAASSKIVLCPGGTWKGYNLKEEIRDHEVIIIQHSSIAPEDQIFEIGIKCIAYIQEWVLQLKDTLLIQVVVPNSGIERLASSLAGMLKAVQTEYNKINFQVIEWSPAEEKSLKRVLDENQQADYDRHISYRQHHRWIKNWAQWKPTLPVRNPWQENGVYLITGGMGGIGQLFCREAIRQTERVTLILTGRSELETNKRDVLSTLTSSGARVLYHPTDISDPDAVQKLIDEIYLNYGKLTGVIHSAAVIQDSLLIKKTKGQIEQVLAPKLKGLVNLDQAIGNRPLDFLSLFSSTTSVIGNIGQTDYAWANSFMDEFAFYRNRLAKAGARQGNTISINWPFWKEGGLTLSPGGIKNLKHMSGMVPMPNDIGIRAFSHMLSGPSAQCLVMYGQTENLKRRINWEVELSNSDLFLDPFSIPTETTYSQDINATPMENINKTLLTLAADVLKVPAEHIDLDTSFEEYGFDSILYAEFAMILNEQFELSLSPTIFFQFATLSSLASHIFDETNSTSETTAPKIIQNRSEILGDYEDFLPTIPKPASAPEQSSHADATVQPEALTPIGENSPRTHEAILFRLQQFASDLLEIPIDFIDPEAGIDEYSFDSIRYTEFAVRINEAFGVDLTPIIFFEYSTLTALASYLQDSVVLPEKDSTIAHSDHDQEATESPQISELLGSKSDRANSINLAPRTGYNNVLKPDTPHALEEHIFEILIQTASTLLEIPTEHIRLDAGMDEYGYDSIRYTEFAIQLNEIWDLDLAPTIFFECESLFKLAGYLQREHLEALIKEWNENKKSAPNSCPLTPEKELVQIHSAKNYLPEDSRPVAIIGMSGKFPKADTLEEFWENLLEGKDCIVPLPEDQWIRQDMNPENDSKASQWAGLIRNLYDFDPEFFNISEQEAIDMDPQHRLLMLYAWKVIEDAGYAPQDLKGSDTAIFVGMASHEFSELIGRQKHANPSFNQTNIISCMGPNRFSYFLDLTGSSEPVDTACSSSLIAIHRAVRSIQSGDSTMAIAGGVNALQSKSSFIRMGHAGMLSKEGRCKTFSDTADGFVRAEGVGMVLLKDLKQAEADGDHIYGIIRSTADNHGGRANALTAPSMRAQINLIKKAYKKAGIDPSTVNFIETHGTGTKLGDPIEVDALKTAFTELSTLHSTKQNYCGLGSIKSHIGHTEYASGVAGVIKVLLQLKHKTLIKNLHCNTISPYIKTEGTPFYLVRKNQEWKAVTTETGGASPRRAGVSAFGFGGVNAHVIIEEYIPKNQTPDEYYSREAQPKIFVFSAQSPEQLQQQTDLLLNFIDSGQAGQEQLADMAYTLQTGRNAMPYRLGFLASNISELHEKLQYFKTHAKGNPDFILGAADLSKSKQPYTPPIAQTGSQVELLSLIQDWVQGYRVNWKLLSINANRKKISLPTYPFRLKVYRLGIEIKDSPNTVQKVTEQQEARESSRQKKKVEATIGTLPSDSICNIHSSSMELGSLHRNGSEAAISIRQTGGILEFDQNCLSHQTEKRSESSQLTDVEQGITSDSAKSKYSKVHLLRQESAYKNSRNVSDNLKTLEPIAVIGVSAELPMAKDIHEFWENLVSERHCVTEIPKERWDFRDYPAVKARLGGFIENMSTFDPLFFNISPAEALQMDPQQRLMMMHIWKAIEDAGYNPNNLAGSNTGIFAAISCYEYNRVLAQSQTPIEGHSLMGMVSSMGPNRISYFLDFKGPSQAIETACSSSLVAIHRAVESIRSGRCDIALAAGVNTLLTPEIYESLYHFGALSDDGCSRAFSDRASGYVRGEGVGVIMLKSLKAAEEAGDHVYGLIRNTNENHGGRANSLTSPNPRAQADLIYDTYLPLDIDPRSVSYVETHGPGTLIGDPVEVTALKNAFNRLYQNHDKPVMEAGTCAIGSVKTNIGHLEFGAGMAGVLKVLMQLKHKKLPKSLFSESINPHLKLENSPFYVVQHTQDWKVRKNDKGQEWPRRAGVSAFGFGGVNGHVLLEEYKSYKPQNLSYTTAQPVLMLLSGQSKASLIQYAKNFIESISKGQISANDLYSMSYTLQVGRAHMKERVALLVRNISELAQLLKQFINGHIESQVWYNQFDTSYKKSPQNYRQIDYPELYASSQLPNLAQLWVNGAEIEWSALYSNDIPRRISLPTYPFERKPYWASPLPKKGSSSPSSDSTNGRVDEAIDSSVIPPKTTNYPEREKMVSTLKEIVAEIIHMPASDIAESKPLYQYGLDSISTSRFIQQVKKIIPDVDNRLLFDYPTVGEAADALLSLHPQSLANIQTTLSSPPSKKLPKDIIKLNAQTEGRPIFWLHPVGGGIEGYHSIAECSRRPFYAVVADTWTKHGKHFKGIADMAQYYTELVLQTQPDGPYDLGGFSLGGALAYEMAKHLQKLGKQVSSIVMIDSIFIAGSMNRFVIDYRSMVLQTVNLLLGASNLQHTEQLADKLIHRDTIPDFPSDQSFLEYVTALAKARGLSSAPEQINAIIERGRSVRESAQFVDYRVLPMEQPEAIDVYYFSNKDKQFYGKLAPYCILHESENLHLDNQQYWLAWKNVLPQFHHIELSAPNHITLMNDKSVIQQINKVCHTLYELS